MSDEYDDLNERLEKASVPPPRRGVPMRYLDDDIGDLDYSIGVRKPKEEDLECSQWTSANGVNFIPAAKSYPEIPAGAYEVQISPVTGLYFQDIKIKTDGILRLPEKNVEKVVDEIERFWTLKDKFEKHELTYKRGILLYGPPGSGKTCAIQLCCSDLIKKHNGIVIRFSRAPLFTMGLRSLRRIEPDRPIIVVMEDMEDLMHAHHESEILQILDGGEKIDNIVFLATTNYPEQLGARIVNRPSRFDKRFRIGMPSEESRKMYLEHLDIENDVDIDKWVEDTEGFSMAHLKELFVAVNILGDEYDEALRALRTMTERPESEKEFKEKEMGFAATGLSGAGMGF